jgi:hypothetical protein
MSLVSDGCEFFCGEYEFGNIDVPEGALCFRSDSQSWEVGKC